MEPVPGENVKVTDEATRTKLLEERATTVKEFESATREWMHGIENANAFMEKRNALAETLRKGYWQLDPYLRARSFWDRTGMIKEDGHVEFYPTAKAPGIASIPAGPAPASHDPNELD